MQDGRQSQQRLKLFIFSQIFHRRDTSFGGRRGLRNLAVQVARDFLKFDNTKQLEPS